MLARLNSMWSEFGVKRDLSNDNLNQVKRKVNQLSSFDNNNKYTR